MKPAPIQVQDYTCDANENQTHGSYVEYKGSKDGKSFTVYRFVRSTISNTMFTKDMEGQIEVLGSLNNPYVQRLYDIVINREDLFAFFDYEWLSLSTLLEKNNKVPESIARQIMYHALCGLDYIHSENVAHLDISPLSITFNKLQIAMLSKFFHAQRFDNQNSLCNKATGTLNFQPPEVFSGKPFNPYKVDIWSLGIVILTLLTNSNVFFGTNEEEIIHNILTDDPPIEKYISQPAQEVLRAALQKDPNKRATAKELLNMEWIKSQRLREDVDMQSIETVFADGVTNKYILSTNYTIEEAKGRILSSVMDLKPLIKYGEKSDILLATRSPEAKINITFRPQPGCLWLNFQVYSASDKEGLATIFNAIMDQFAPQNS